MAVIEGKGLRGLPGLNNISEQERQTFMLANDDKLRQYRSPGKRKKAAEILYNNQQFINTFGQEEFDKYSNGSQAAYDYRNNMLREKVIGDAFDRAYKPQEVNGKIDINTGAGEDWGKISELSTDAKEELLKSDWKTPAQRREEQKNRDAWYEKVIDFVAGEAIQQYKKESNQKILDRIYNDNADSVASRQGDNVSRAYMTPEITGTSDEDTKKRFREAVIPNAKTGNRGIPEYASHLDEEEMENFSIDDMRQVLAKKYVYDRTMSPDMAFTALNNEAKRYITQNQSGLTRFGLFAKDVGISAMSYTADKINGIYNLILAAEDSTKDLPEVFVDDSGNILDPKKTNIMQTRDGKLFYDSEDGARHSVHKEQIDRRTLHNMGKEEDGSDAAEGIFHLNPLYWTRAEQFGTLDADEQKQWEKLGSSPHKVAYNPNDERDLVYESFKMASFGIADAASMLIPFGVGAAGRVLSTASKVGKVGRGLGKAMDTAGRYLGAQTKIGSVAQGLAGAGGIAYAYQRGAFQETLAENLANAEEANLNKSKQELFNLYNNNEQFKAQVDAQVATRAAEMKQEYLTKLAQEGQGQVVDEAALDEMMMARANDEVHNNLLQQRVQENKGSQEYAALQQQAIKEAGDAAWLSFWPEAIKYGLVNTVGYRKFLYTNPQGLKKSVSGAFKGLREVTTEGGAKRLATGATEFGTLGAKAKKFGKVAGSQFWGGAWTNGTDDMMVDAAERVSHDSFDRYLNAYENGEALADEYGFIDGIYSYWKGLNNSLGQETTREAATVGGFGSIVSASPNMANIAHLATKEGKDAYRDRFQKRVVYDTDANGYKTIKRDEQGNPVTEDVSWKDNWRERAGFFIQNGVLNTYYGAKQNERDLQSHADYVNSILDRQDDFNALKNLIASDIERQNVTLGKGTNEEEHTMRFIHAFNSIAALDQLSKDKNDAIKFSSVVDEAMSLINNASKIGTDESTMSEEQMANLIAEYYRNNPGVEQSDEGNRIAINNITKNAQKMMEAYEAFNDANKQIDKYEQEKGISILSSVRNKMVLFKSLTGHWKDRLNTMNEELGISSSRTAEPEGEELIASYGGIGNARRKVKSYEEDPVHGEILYTTLVNTARAEVTKKLEKYNKILKTVQEASDSEARYAAEQNLKKARVEYEDAVESRDLLQDRLSAIQEKKNKLQRAIEEHEAKDKEEKRKQRVLSADEILALDPITRARMLNEQEAMSYSPAQRKQVNEVIKRLNGDGEKGDALQKIQDIATLTVRVGQAEDAYSRMLRNPDAAALQLEKQTVQEAEKAYNLINRRNAQTLANAVKEIEDGLKVKKDVKKEGIEDIAYRMLRRHSNTLLDIIDKENLLPQFKTQVDQAREWSSVLTDIDAVVNSQAEDDAWKQDAANNIDRVISSANSRQGIINNLEKAIDDINNPAATEAFEKVLAGLAQIGYQRDATVIENRKQRREREEQARQKKEADRKAQEETVEKAAADAKTKAMEDAARTPQISEEDKRADKTMTKEGMSNVEDILLEDEDSSSTKSEAANYMEGKKYYEKVINSEEPAESKIAANFHTIEKKAEKGEITVDDAWAIVKHWNPDANETEVKAAINYIINKKAPRNADVRKRAIERAEEGIGFHSGDVIQDEKGHKYTVIGYEWTGIDGENKDYFVSSTIVGEPVIVLQTESGVKERQSAGDFYNSWKEKRRHTWTKVDSVSIEPISSEPSQPATTPAAPVEDVSDTNIPVGPVVEPIVTRIAPSFLMSEDVEEGSVSDGEMWTDDAAPQKGVFTVTRKNVGKNAELSFTVGNNPTTLSVTSNEWVFSDNKEDAKAVEESLKENGITKNTSFRVSVIEQFEDGKWYLTGRFEGTDFDMTVEPTDKFDLNKVIDRQRQEREDAAIAQGLDVGNPNVIDDGEFVSFKADSVADQADSSDDIMETDDTNEADTANEQGQKEQDGDPSKPVTLSGTAMLGYDKDALWNHNLVQKKGVKPNDSMNHFYAWLDNQRVPIKLQNVIDVELPQIYEQDNNVKVKFMCVKPEDSGIVVGDTIVDQWNNISNHIFLVVDYNSDVQDIHNEENGGVITAAGKKYLIVGTVGYGNIKAEDEATRNYNKRRQDMFNTILQIPGKDGMTIRSNIYYQKNPNETYRVLEDVYTEIIPKSMTPGFMIKQIEGSPVEHMSISEVLKAQNERDGTAVTLADLKWGIQEWSDFLPVKESKDKVMKPGRVEENVGAAFVLIPAGNGKNIPVHIDARRYSEMREGALKNKVDRLLSNEGLLANNYKTRYDALISLGRIFYLNEDNNNILVGKDKTSHANEVTLVNADGDTIYSIKVGGVDVDIDAFKSAFTHKFDPRVNITANNLRDTNRLVELDEAGALDVDVSMLRAAGVSYSIYPVDISGEILKPEEVSNKVSTPKRDTEFTTERNQVWYSGVAYEYASDKKEYVYNGIHVTEESDPTLFEALEFNRSIIRGKLTANYTSGNDRFYVMRDGEHPLIVKEDVHHRLTQLSEKKSKEVIDKIKEEAEKKKREEEAEKKLKSKQPEDIDLSEIKEESETDEEGIGDIVVDDNTGLVIRKPAEPLDVLLQYAKGEIEYSQAIEQLKDTEYVRFVGGSKLLRTSDHYELRGVEQMLGEYLMKKYPNLTVEGVNVDTGMGLSGGGSSVIVVKDVDGIEYGSPSNFIHSLEKGGRALEALAKEKKETGVSDNAGDNKLPPATKPEEKADTQTFEALMKKKKYKTEIYERLAKKWPELGIDIEHAKLPDMETLRNKLLEKGMLLDGIGTSEADIKAWMDTIEKCR